MIIGGIYSSNRLWTVTIETTGVDQTFNILLAGTTVSIFVDWGDGTNNLYDTAGTKARTYASAGVYKIRISGALTGAGRVYFYTGTNTNKILATTAITSVTGITTAQDMFRGATNAKFTALPDRLFSLCPLIAANGFASTFKGCTALTSLPTDLFRYNTAVSTNGFFYTFYACTALTSLPTDLFRYNTAVSTNGFYCTFYGCTKLQLRADIFYPAGEQATRFLNTSPNFTSCFDRAAFNGTQGTAPDLWACDYGTGTPTTTTCFGGAGNSATSLTNYDDIPVAWK